MAEIYILTGTSGMWEDRETWPVAAYYDKQAATARRNALLELWVSYDEQFEADTSLDAYDRMLRVRAAMQDDPNGDPNCHIDFGGLDYYVETVPLAREA